MFRFIRKKNITILRGNVMVESTSIFVMKLGGKIDEEGKSFGKL